MAKDRVRILLIFFSLCLLYFLFTLFRMQVFGYQSYQSKVLRQITVGSSLSAERGEILDRNGVVLATNQTVWRIYLSPVDIQKARKKDGKDYAAIIAEGLGELLGLDKEELFKKASASAYLDQTVLKKANKETTEAVMRFVKENGLSSMVHAEAGSKRYYPFSSLAAHTIGFTGSDNQGLFGLEAYYDKLLTGRDGQYISAVDSQGVKLPSAYTDYIKAENGLTVQTTLDVYVQAQLERCLEEAIAATGAQNRATGIVMNVKTGGILAMATAPSFDLNDPYTLDTASKEALLALGYSSDSSEYKKAKSDLLYKMWRNKAVTEIYEPGSTFKIITAAVAIEEKAVKTQSPFFCAGSYVVGGCRISCHKRKGHGSITFTQGVQQSCNPCMMQTVEKIGASAFYRYFIGFGYGEKTGIDLPGEGIGTFHSEASLGTTELATASFGQRFKVSVLQQLCAVSAVANGGVLVTPHLLDAVLDKDGNTLYTYKTEEKRQVISAETAKTVSTILEGGVSGDGGAKNAAVLGYQIAAKTGTSEKFDILDANGQSYLRIGSCIGYAPYDEAEIAIIFIVDEPTCQIKYGSVTAAPYVGKLFEAILPYLGIDPAEQEAVEVQTSNYVGLSPENAKALLRKQGLSVSVVGNGSTVLAQTPAPATKLTVGLGNVILYTEECTLETVVPSLIGKTGEEAVKLLLDASLNVGFDGIRNHSFAKDATVTAQSLPPGYKVKKGTVVTLTLLYTDIAE